MNNFQDGYTPDMERLARYSKALSHPARVFILQFLSQSMDSCCYSGDMVEILPIARSTLSQHLKELKEAGLIQGEILPPKIKYCINRENWEEARALMVSFFLPSPPQQSCAIPTPLALRTSIPKRSLKKTSFASPVQSKSNNSLTNSE